MATPLIRIPQEQGGTMYAFSNAARDLTRSKHNPDMAFEYSKFALLDLPAADSTSGSNDNYIKYGNLFEAGVGGAASQYIPDLDANIDFARTIQNYALNLENFILSDDDFDNELYSSLITRYTLIYKTSVPYPKSMLGVIHIF